MQGLGFLLPPADALKYTLELPVETPSNNEIRGLKFWEYKEVLRAWQARVFQALGCRTPAKPLNEVFIYIERRSSGTLDWDNAYGGLKPLLDCLVMPSTRNPCGLGLIKDDSPTHVPHPPYFRQLKAPKEKGSTLVQIFDISNLSLPTSDSSND